MPVWRVTEQVLLGLHGDARDLRRGSLEPVLDSPPPPPPRIHHNASCKWCNDSIRVLGVPLKTAKSVLGIQTLALLIGQSQEVGTVTVPMSQLGCVTGEVTCLHAEL